MQRDRLNQIVREYRGLMVFFALMLVFRSACADWMIVPTASMNPTIIEGDRILVNKHAYGWRVPFTMTRITQGDDPQRGEIAVFYSPADGKRLVKRVIGVPGDTVELRDDVLFINGQPQTYAPDATEYELPDAAAQLSHVFFTEKLVTSPRPVDHPIMLLPHQLAMTNFGPIKVTTDHYFMMGDNRDNSRDSRYFGLASRESFGGRASKIVASLDPDHWYVPRSTRFWHELK